MDEDALSDLKQFIVGAIAQQVGVLHTDIQELQHDMTIVKQDIVGLNKKVDNLSSSVADALDNLNEMYGAQLKDHGRRIVRLERKAA